MTIITKVAEVEAALSVLNSALDFLKWRLKPYAKRRLQTDVLALCTGLRPVVMVDYGGKMPELQAHLYSILQHAQKESATFQHLRIMVIEDMIYLVNVDEFAQHISWCLNSGVKQVFVDLEHDPVKMIDEATENSVVMQLLLIQKFFSSVFTGSGVNHNALQFHRNDFVDNAQSSTNDFVDNAQSSTKLAASQFSEVIDLSCCLQDSQVTIPTLNGWLLSYPVVYLFGKEHIPDAVYNLSTKSLHIFKVLVCRNVHDNGRSQLEELMSFSVPYHLSLEGRNEPWSKAFWLQMETKWGRCKNAWKSLQLEVTECYPQAIVL